MPAQPANAAIEGEWLAGLLFAGYTAFVLWLWLRDDDDDSRD